MIDKSDEELISKAQGAIKSITSKGYLTDADRTALKHLVKPQDLSPLAEDALNHPPIRTAERT